MTFSVLFRSTVGRIKPIRTSLTCVARLVTVFMERDMAGFLTWGFKRWASVALSVGGPAAVSCLCSGAYELGGQPGGR